MAHNIAILASGSGTNAENIICAFKNNSTANVALVISNKPDAPVLDKAVRHGVKTLHISNDDFVNNPRRIIDELHDRHIDLVVLAGFMRKVHSDIIAAYPNRIINIHPSLLPAYGGKGMWGHHVHEAVIAAGEHVSGITVHYVTDDIDGGAIVAQREVPVMPHDTATTLEERIHDAEYEAYPAAILSVLKNLPEE